MIKPIERACASLATDDIPYHSCLVDQVTGVCSGDLMTGMGTYLIDERA